MRETLAMSCLYWCSWFTGSIISMVSEIINIWGKKKYKKNTLFHTYYNLHEADIIVYIDALAAAES